jgi:hypothetical protein
VTTVGVMSRLVLSCASILVAACAGPARNTTAAAAPPAPQKPLAQASASSAAPGAAGAPAPKTARAKVICEMERPTGSNMPQRVCHMEETAEAVRLRTQDALRASPRMKIDEGLPSAPRAATPAGNR